MGSTGNMGRALAVTIPVTFYLFLEHRKSDLTKIFLIAMIVAQFYGIIVAMSRTPWYALLIALFLMQIFYPQFRKVFLAIVFAAAIGLVATWDQVSQSQVANRVNDDNSTLEGREARWASATAMWRRKPIYGWGYGWYERDSGKFRTDGGRTSFEAIESDFLNVLVSAGLVGLVPYILFITAIIVNAMRLFFKARAPDWPGFVKSETIVVCGAVLAVLLICSYTQVNTQPVIKLIVFSVAGATVGSHEYLLRRKIENVNTPTRLRPNMM
jgi:O-antigen ligase